ncbi:uncharacterised protein family UPF0047 [Kipferlia bialata]|uniref:Secondary thiamine-phosphate synthase enzyme n=1 Tax=Kipferlia bialata TaxID=797122 RepID=A0A9K3CRY2_9EUKA|nr:uncharacterised protein family UPF0047 [Kipferlia bialata]|eukprot:g2265.t1
MGYVCEQVEFSFNKHSRGVHLVTDEVEARIGKALGKVRCGTCHLFILHTSASLSVNEGWDPSVRADVRTILDRLVPEKATYEHCYEGDDDMPAHMKSVLTGTSVTIPVTNGRLNMGQWQGVYLLEHRDGSHVRSCIATVQGSG